MARKNNTKDVFLIPEFEGLDLSIRYQKFVLAYVRPDINYNGTRAYLEAFDLDEKHYDHARTAASGILAIPNVKKAVRIASQKQLANHEELGRRVLEEWTKLAFFDLQDALSEEDDEIKVAPGFLKSGQTPSIKYLEVSKQNGIKIATHDKIKALENIARCLGMFNDTIKPVGESYEGLVQRLARQEKEKNQ